MSQASADRLQYSVGNEDWRTEHHALRINPKDRVLAYTGSGDRVLHLLLEDCQEVIAVDPNPRQNFLLELKCVGIRHLPYEEYLSFLGVRPSSTRLSTLSRLLPEMTEECRKFWSDNSSLVAKGVLYQGEAEKWYQFLSKWLRLFRRNKIQTLFSMEDLEEQKRFVNAKWQGGLWKKAVTLALHPPFAKLFGRHAGAILENHSELGTRIEQLLQRSIANESPLLSLSLKGKMSPECFPPSLSEGGFAVIRERLDRLHFVTQDMVAYLMAAPENSFDAYSLSDPSLYIDQRERSLLLQEVSRTAREGARFCIRSHAGDSTSRETSEPRLKRNSALEELLGREDRGFHYQFMVGSVTS